MGLFFFVSKLVFLKKKLTKTTSIKPKLNSRPAKPNIKKLKVNNVKSSVKPLSNTVYTYKNTQASSDKKSNCIML